MPSSITLRAPKLGDAANVSQWLAKFTPEDASSIYLHLLKMECFATSVVALYKSKPVGFLEGRISHDQQTLKVEQLVVDEQFRQQGVAIQMIESLFARQSCCQACHLEASFLESNQASMALFKKLAQMLSTDLSLTLESIDKESKMTARISVSDPIFPTIAAKFSGFLPVHP